MQKSGYSDRAAGIAMSVGLERLLWLPGTNIRERFQNAKAICIWVDNAGNSWERREDDHRILSATVSAGCRYDHDTYATAHDAAICYGRAFLHKLSDALRNAITIDEDDNFVERPAAWESLSNEAFQPEVADYIIECAQERLASLQEPPRLKVSIELEAAALSLHLDGAATKGKEAATKDGGISKPELEVILERHYQLNPEDENLTSQKLLPRLNKLLCKTDKRTSASQIKKCDRYSLACDNTGRSRSKPEITRMNQKRESSDAVLHKLISQQNRELAADSGARVNGRLVVSRD